MTEQRTEGAGPDSDESGAEIRVLGLEDLEVRGVFRRPDEWRVGRGSVSAEDLRERIAAFMETLQTAFEKLPDDCGGFSLDSITLSAEVSAKGHLSLLGAGGELAGKSGLTFVFKRNPAPAAAADPEDGAGE